MVEKQGIKETMEVLSLVTAVTLFLVNEARTDGIQIEDLGKLFTKPDFPQKLMDAVNGSSAIPGELQDLSKFEVLDISEFLLKAGRDVFVGVNGTDANSKYFDLPLHVLSGIRGIAGKLFEHRAA